MDEGTEIKIDDDGDEAEKIKVAPDPSQPTRRQIEEHRITH